MMFLCDVDWFAVVGVLSRFAEYDVADMLVIVYVDAGDDDYDVYVAAISLHLLLS